MSNYKQCKYPQCFTEISLNAPDFCPEHFSPASKVSEGKKCTLALCREHEAMACAECKPTENNWEKRFDVLLKDFADNIYFEGDPLRTKGIHEQDLKAFIRELIEQERKEAYERGRAKGHIVRDIEKQAIADFVERAVKEIWALYPNSPMPDCVFSNHVTKDYVISLIQSLPK